MPARLTAAALELGLPEMDRPHLRFARLLAQAAGAGDAALLDAWRELVAETGSQFDQQEAWMTATRFPSMRCHADQHHVVLHLLREVMLPASAWDLVALREMIPELARWFLAHVQGVDASLAMHLRTAGSFTQGHQRPGNPKAAISPVR